jgi:hypothetical protein
MSPGASQGGAAEGAGAPCSCAESAALAVELRRAQHTALSRMPNGVRMTNFRWAPVTVPGGGPLGHAAEAVWTFPAGTPDPALLSLRAHRVRWTVRMAEGGDASPDPRAFAFWLGTAIRQDLWRDLRAMRGLMPSVRVIAEPQGVAVTAVCLLARGRAGPAVAAGLADLFTPAARSGWTGWALRKSRRKSRGKE